ncbi:SpoIID/LytB domain-containing protein [Bacillus atrophaeus]|uniref:SpoIID/LytB domain-containing protein n=1 Tax=Bacillus atrophaeus TaxID=1452 RepID=UPI0022822C93|nr:SpoIID/LytB domain-containing protein [Bacillus atrophaeus]MCY8941725.1 SpoIID/LytB domain-containing protein [Bacillus atrophaeus]
MKKKILAVCVSVIFSLALLPENTLAASSNISVKLTNYIGNKSTLDIESSGTYKMTGSNVSAVTRLGGASKYDTANTATSNYWKNPSNVVVVNTDAYFADTLSVIPLAYKLKAPILLTEQKKLSTSTEAQIKKYNPDNILVIGGTNSISSAAEKTLKKYGQTKRISGKNRYDLSKNIAKEMGSYDQAVVVTGDVYTDALAIAPYAAKNGYPILLTKKDSLPSYDLPKKVIIMGGTSSVSKTVENQIKLKSTVMKRITGSNRYQISANVITSLGMDASKVVTANGTKLADMVVGSNIAANNNIPLFYVKKDETTTDVKNIFKNKGTYSYTLIGSTNSITDSVKNSYANEFYLVSGKTYQVNASGGKLGIKNINSGKSSFKAIPEKYSTANSISINGKPYLGDMNFSVESSKYVRPVNENIPFEDYLKGVLPNEMPGSWPIEALKAQAVAARTYSISSVGKTVADTTAFQVYGGYSWYPNATKAVDGTKGKVLEYSGKLITANYSSSNGGYTEASDEVWGAQVPYLTAKKDTMDPEISWSVSLLKNQMATNLNMNDPNSWWSKTTEQNATQVAGIKNWLIKNKETNARSVKIASISGLTFSGKTKGQRAEKATIKLTYHVDDKSKGYVLNKNATIDVKASEFRTMIGASSIKSTYASVSSDSKQFTISGKGYGHGVGMSQYGAKERAESGDSYTSILKFYYPGTTLTNY